MVACRRDGVEQYSLRYPTVIVEVLSRSTAAIDRREKRINYTQIPSLEEYVIASQEEPELLCHRRAANWVPERIAGPAAALDLRSIDLALPLAEIYARVI
jgi:Uma2 family endonuclease